MLIIIYIYITFDRVFYLCSICILIKAWVGVLLNLYFSAIFALIYYLLLRH